MIPDCTLDKSEAIRNRVHGRSACCRRWRTFYKSFDKCKESGLIVVILQFQISNPMKHKTPIQIRFKDVDAMGHVNNANHLTYFEYARIQYFDAIVGKEIDWENEGIILAQQTVNYKKPIYLKDIIHVSTWFVKSGNTSFEIGYEIIRTESDGTETICATGSTIQVCYSYKLKTAIAIPASWAEKMRNAEL